MWNTYGNTSAKMFMSYSMAKNCDCRFKKSGASATLYEAGHWHHGGQKKQSEYDAVPISLQFKK